MQETPTTSKLANATSLEHHALRAGLYAQGLKEKLDGINKINRIF
jgi:hypothetical protein